MTYDVIPMKKTEQIYRARDWPEVVIEETREAALTQMHIRAIPVTV